MDSGRQQNPKQEAGAVISFGPRRLSLFEHFVTISPVCNNIRIVMEIGRSIRLSAPEPRSGPERQVGDFYT